MPISFERCSHSAYRFHPEVAGAIVSEVKTAILVSADLDASNGTLGRAALNEQGPAVYVLGEIKLYNDTFPQLYFLDVTYEDKFYRLIMEDAKGWKNKKTIEVQAIAPQFVKADTGWRPHGSMLAQQRLTTGMQLMTNTVANQTGTGVPVPDPSAPYN
jgi:hypothetical protein